MAARQRRLESGGPARRAARPPLALQRAALAGACLALALLAQWALDHRLSPALAAGSSVVAAAMFGALAHPWRAPVGPETARRRPWTSRDSALCLGVAALGAVAFIHFAGNRFSAAGLAAWLPGFILLAVAAWEPETPRPGRQRGVETRAAAHPRPECQRGASSSVNQGPSLRSGRRVWERWSSGRRVWERWISGRWMSWRRVWERWSSGRWISGRRVWERWMSGRRVSWRWMWERWIPGRWMAAGGITLRWRHLALLGAMAVAAFLRLHRIGEVPLEMGCDLPHSYDNIRQILAGEAPIYFPSHPGREGLFFYLAAPLAAVVGLSHTTIKAASALIGVLTIPAVYLLGREVCDRETGLVAALFLAVSHWHVILTRVGYRAAVLPPVLALMWLFLARGTRTGGRMAYAVAGLFLGLGFYTYNASMIVPLLVVLLLLGEVAAGRGRRLTAHGPGLALLAVTAAYVLIPLARYVYDDPFRYTYRVATRLTDLEQPLPADLLGTLLRNAARAAAMFTYEGDAIFSTNVAFRRQLGYVPAVGFVLGIGCYLRRWRDGGLALLSGLGVMLLPSILALAFPHEVPSAVRSIGALPPAMLVAAVGVVQVRRSIAAGLEVAAPWGRRLAGALLVVGTAVVLGGEARATYTTYFRDYVRQQPDQNYSISLEMARAIARFEDTGPAYILAAPHWYDGNAVRAQLGRAPDDWDLELAELVPGRPPLDGRPGKVMVIVHPGDREALAALEAAFARSIVLEHTKYDGTPAFLTFYGER